MANCLSYAINSVALRGTAPPATSVYQQSYWIEYLQPNQDGSSKGPTGQNWTGLAGCLDWLINVSNDTANATAMISELTGIGFEWRSRGDANPNPTIDSERDVIVVGNYNGGGGIHFFSSLANSDVYMGIPSADSGGITAYLVNVNGGNGGQFTQNTAGVQKNGIITGWFRRI
ncbi:MAG: hypothetical protein N4A35_08715 [Flavobacteriales bacterium]|jgi:sarcosine oxidase delta subunit|nr:hypothetical protein [Flavobacteriales bacterium]